MKKQIPNWLFGALLAISVVGVLWVIGRATPRVPGASGAGDIHAGASSDGGAPAFPVEKVSDFSGPTTDGQTFKLSDTRGKVVLLNFWATWCGPCRYEIPDLIKVQEKYRDRGFTVVGVSQDDSLDIAAKFVKANGLNYPVLICDPQTQRELGFRGIPTSVLLDKEGKIVWMQEGIDQSQSVEAVLSEQIEKVL